MAMNEPRHDEGLGSERFWKTPNTLDAEKEELEELQEEAEDPKDDQIAQ